MVKTRTPKVISGTVIILGRSAPAHKVSGVVYYLDTEGKTLTVPERIAQTFRKEKK